MNCPPRQVAARFSRARRSENKPAKAALGMRKVTTMIMTNVAAIVMRTTVFTRPGYEATSQRMNARNQTQEIVGRAGRWGNCVARVAISRLPLVSADDYYRRFAQTNAVRGR